MEAKKLISLILNFILFSSFVSIAENIEIAPLISLDQLEPTYDQEEKEDLNINENKIPYLDTENEIGMEMLVTLKILNKITANVEQIEIKLKENYEYDYLEIYAIDCYLSDKYEKTEKAVYLNIYNREINEKIFNGWMLKTLPSISSLEHPIYDIWIEDCN